jgi:uncharacterized tellurite resistance protein B-like protein
MDSQQKKLAFFQNLLLVAAADRVLDEGESQLLLQVGNQLGLTSEQVNPMVDNLSVLSFVIPEDGLQKTLELQTLVQMMLQDGQMHDHEYQLCLEYTRRIGYSSDMLDEMIQQLSGNQPGH